MELDCSDNREWYRVRIDPLAEFVVRAYSEDHAELKTQYYIFENPWLLKLLAPGLDPENVVTDVLESNEANYQTMVGNYYDPVILTAFTNADSLPCTATEANPEPNPSSLRALGFVGQE